MRVHFDVLGWLHMSMGAFGVLTGLSLTVLGAGTTMALAAHRVETPGLPMPAWVLFGAGFVCLAVGAVTFVVGRALVARRPIARLAALVLAVPSLAAVPFGTALAVYSFWALLNDDARREYEPRQSATGRIP